MKASKIAFERRYDDGSGVQYGVYYDEAERTDWNVRIVGPGDSVVRFPYAELRWYIEALRAVAAEIGEPPESTEG